MLDVEVAVLVVEVVDEVVRLVVMLVVEEDCVVVT